MTYDFASYQKSQQYQRDKERILNTGSKIDEFDRHIEQSSKLPAEILTKPFDI